MFIKKKKKTFHHVDFTNATDFRIKIEREKIDKYLDLARELKKPDGDNN